MFIKDFDPYDFSKTEIGGVPVYYKNLPWAPCINIRIVFNSGAFDDPVGKEGLAHFLEHLPANGSKLLPDKKSVLEWSKQNTLNSRNAWTSFNNTGCSLKCLPEKYSEVLKVMKDLIFFPHLRPEDVEHERKIVTQEAWGYLSNEKYLNYIKEYLKNTFYGHTRERFYNSAGWPETITKITREDIVSWHQTHYGVGNMFIVLTGAVEKKHIDEIQEFIKGLPTTKKLKIEYGTLGKPKENKVVKTAEEIGEVKEQVEISIQRVAERIHIELEETKNLSFRLLQDLLFEKLRLELSLCYGLSCGGWSSKTFFMGYMNVKTDEKNIEIIEKEFQKVLFGIKNNEYEKRFETIKKVSIEQIKAQEMLSSDIASETLEEVSKFDGQIVTQKEQLEKREKVTYDDVAKFIDWAFDPEYTYTEIILPSKKDAK